MDSEVRNSKEDILKNLREYSSDDLFEAIQAGTVTFDEIREAPQFSSLCEKRLRAKLGLDSEENVEPEIDIVPEPELDSTNDIEPELNGVIDIEPVNAIEEEVPAFTNKGMFRAPFSFKGRIRRLEFFLSSIIVYIANEFIGYLILAVVEYDSSNSFMIIVLLLLFIPILWFAWAAAAKRSHDVGNSGWMQLIPFYNLLLLFVKGETNTNKYGDNPKK